MPAAEVLVCQVYEMLGATAQLSSAMHQFAWPLRDRSGRPLSGESTAIFASLGSGGCLGVSCPIIYNIPG
jgi:hypothetical protein